MNVELSSLELYPCEPNNIKNCDKVDSLLEILAELVERPKHTNNLSLKAYKFLKKK